MFSFVVTYPLSISTKKIADFSVFNGGVPEYLPNQINFFANFQILIDNEPSWLWIFLLDTNGQQNRLIYVSVCLFVCLFECQIIIY